MTIQATYEASVPSAARTAFNLLLADYDSLFTNSITVTVDIAFGAVSLSSSADNAVGVSYSAWRSDMAAASNNAPGDAYLAAAVASLPLSDPLNSLVVAVPNAEAKALGINVSENAGEYDSTLTFSNAADVFEYSGTATPGLTDFMTVAQHELNEALGIASSLTGISNFGALPTILLPEDYFRYASPGTRSFTTNPTATSYFSYNGGVTDIARFNQDDDEDGFVGADRNDWIYGNSGCSSNQAPGPYIQDAIICPDQAEMMSASTPESIVLQSLGFSEQAAPESEPATPEPSGALLTGALAAVAAAFRLFKRGAAGRERA